MSVFDQLINPQLIQRTHLPGNNNAVLETNSPQKLQKLNGAILIQINLPELLHDILLVLRILVPLSDVGLELLETDLAVTACVDVCEQ